MARHGYRPAIVRLGNGEFEVHPDGKVYARICRTLHRVRDPELLAELRRAMREHQERQELKQKGAT